MCGLNICTAGLDNSNISYFNSTFIINEFLGIIHPIPVFISPNIISFSMHTPGILGLPRRIFDYPTVYFRFHRLQSFGIIGIALPSAVSASLG